MKDFWQKQVKKYKKLVFLAPMDGYGDSAYRQTIKKIASNIFLISEFYSTHSIVYSESIANRVLTHAKIENPLVIQIFGKDPEMFVKAAKIISNPKYNIAGIDINMGCPAKKIIKSGHGGSLFINQNIAFEIVDVLNKSTNLPISVKTRLSFDGNQNLIDFAKGLENAGCSLLTVHGRTTKQGYGGKADFSQIYDLKRHLDIPIICNGDIINYDDGMKKVKNLDGFMIGRKSFGNPWCFLPGNINPTLREVLDIMEFHAKKLVETKGERKGSLEIRKHLVQYLKYFPGVKSYRKRLVTTESLKNSLGVIDEIRCEFEEFLGEEMNSLKVK